MPTVSRTQTTRIRWPSPSEQIEAKKLQATLVGLNKSAKVGTRTVAFRVGRHAVQTDEAMRALLSGTKVKATVVQWKTARGSKLVSGGYYKAKVRVHGVKMAEFTDVSSFAKWTQDNVLKSPKDV